MTNEQIISQYLQTAYTDEQLAALLAHAEDGKLSFYSCCCLAGIPTANHALQSVTYAADGWWELKDEWTHENLETDEQVAVSDAFKDLADGGDRKDLEDAERRAKLIPLVKAEILRRDSLREYSESLVRELVG